MARRWFRFGQKQENDRAEHVSAPEVAAPPPDLPRQEDTAPEPAAGETAVGPKRRRRGSRGGRGRGKTNGAGAPTGGSPAAAVEAPAVEAAQPRSGRSRTSEGRPADKRQQRTRRRTPTKRAPLPAAKRELVIAVDVGEQRVAILEDERVAEVYLERPERRSIAGNIYLGQVDNVLPGMEAAFVEIGLEKNGFLYVDEIVGPELEGRKGARKIQDLIKRGQTLMVQAVKDPMKSKGARLTTEISLPGRFLVYVPNGEGSGVSRRLDDPERTRLKDILKKLDPKGGGIIVRTAAEGASAEDIERDLVFLQRLWKTIQTKAKSSSAPSLVYEEAELPLRIVRDLFAGDFVGARIDDDRTHRRIVSYLKKTSPHMVERVHRYRDKEPLFEVTGVESEIRSTLDRRVDLPSGGYLVFDYAEAFTVIDVNTGRFVGSRGKSAQGRLEDTIVKNNLEAVKEVVRQLRLRDIGGIIVIDFIDMANPKNRETVEEALRSELERDRTKTYVVEISPLGLVEMTRQNVTDGPREILTSRCPVCAGAGVIVSDATHALEVERRLREIAKGSRVQAFEVEIHPRVLALLAGPGGARLESLEAAARRRFFLVPATANGHVHLDHFEVLRQGKLDTLRPPAPVEEGASLDVKLVELGLHDPSAGVAKLDGGYEVVVADAAKLVGKKVTVTVGRVLTGVAYAALADAAVSTHEPITFEAEAEKPTRAPRGKKEIALEDGGPPDAAEEPDDVDDVESEVPAEPAEQAEAEAAGDVQPPKKRTRRGTRGGRGRKRPAARTAEDPSADGSSADRAGADTSGADGSGADGSGAEESGVEHLSADVSGVEEASDAAAVAGDGRATPRIHVPSPQLDAPADGPSSAIGDVPESSDGGDETSDAQPKRKRSRRGSRGGRKRKKPATNGDGVDATEAEPAEAGHADEAEAEAEPAEAGHADEGEPRYVPMSEWIEDFDARSSR